MTRTIDGAEKLYRVEFNSYTDSTKMSISDNTHSSYIQIPLGGLIVAESKLTYYMKYGEGLKSIELVGSMYHGEV